MNLRTAIQLLSSQELGSYAAAGYEIMDFKPVWHLTHAAFDALECGRLADILNDPEPGRLAVL